MGVGDKVEKGQVLAQVLSSELVALQQQYLTARSNLQLASLEQRRDKTLLAEGVIAERRWQETQAMHNSKAALADEAKQLLLMAGMTAPDISVLDKTRKLDSLFYAMLGGLLFLSCRMPRNLPPLIVN